jgi:hypothetical protein
LKFLAQSLQLYGLFQSIPAPMTSTPLCLNRL